jgi:hypothetical protein
MNSVRRVAYCLVLILFGTGAEAGAAGSDTARQILNESQRRTRTESQEYRGELIVTAKNGKERRKEWKSYHQGSAANSDRLIRFLSPPEVRGVGYLGKQRPGKAPDEWLYLPSMKRERRIAARDRENAFVGTDFNYEDLELVEFDESRYDVELLPEQVINGHSTFTIELRPRARSLYERKIVSIRKDSYTFAAVEFFFKGDHTPSKRLTLTDEQQIEGHPIPLRIEMADLRKGSRTVVVLHDVALNRPQPADRFTIQNLLREDADLLGALRMPAGRSAARQAPAVAQTSDVAAPRFGQTFTGFVEAKSFGYVSDINSPESRLRSWGTVLVKEAARIGPVRMSGVLRMEQTSSSQVGPAVFDPADRKPRRSAVSLRELTISAPVMSGVDVEVGRFDLGWGQTDGYSPADAFIPRDLTDALSGELLPLWGARMRGERGGIRFEVLDVPVTTPWRLPAIEGREISSEGVFLADVGLNAPVPKSGFVAARVKSTIAGWDVGVWGRSGVRPAPVLDQEADVQPDVFPQVIPIGRHYAHERAIGGEVSRVVDGWVWRGEVGVLRSNDAELGDAVLWTIGTSRDVRDGTFTVTFASNAIEPPVNRLLLFDRALLPAIILAADELESWGAWKVAWLGTLHTIGGIMSAEVTKRLTEAVALTAGTDLPHGSELSPASAFAGGKRVRAALRWTW